MDNTQITVTSPLLPELDELDAYLQDIWSRKWITNNGHYHKELEAALCEYLKVPYISLFTNGTLPLITALQALRINGEVITTPFSFVATTHSIWWNGIKPVFVDIDPSNCGINPDCIEAAITPDHGHHAGALLRQAVRYQENTGDCRQVWTESDL